MITGTGSLSEYKLIFTLVLFLIAPNFHAQVKENKVQVTAAAVGNSKDKLTISPLSATINFGEFVNLNGGTVTLNPCSGLTIPDLISNFIILNQGSAANFEISSTLGNPTNITLTISPSTSIVLTNGTESITLSNLFLCIDGSPINLIDSNTLTFTVGSKFDPPTNIRLGGDLIVPSGVSGTYSSPAITITIQ